MHVSLTIHINVSNYGIDQEALAIRAGCIEIEYSISRIDRSICGDRSGHIRDIRLHKQISIRVSHRDYRPGKIIAADSGTLHKVARAVLNQSGVAI